ncbi:MAG: SCO family protein [Acidimicrobiales bacterium]
MTPRRYLRNGIAAAVAVVTMTIVLGGCGDDEPAPFAGFERSPAPVVADLSLPSVEADGSESEFSFAANEGDILLVYFGYTSCPDVCPTTLSDVRRAADRIGDDRARIDLAMITIDPDVDTPDVLSGYVRSFLPEATAVRTTDDARLRAVADVFGADYGALAGDGERQVYHTGSLYAVGSSGELLLTWPFGVPVDDLERDLSRLLDEAV